MANLPWEPLAKFCLPELPELGTRRFSLCLRGGQAWPRLPSNLLFSLRQVSLILNLKGAFLPQSWSLWQLELEAGLSQLQGLAHAGFPRLEFRRGAGLACAEFEVPSVLAREEFL